MFVVFGCAPLEILVGVDLDSFVRLVGAKDLLDYSLHRVVV